MPAPPTIRNTLVDEDVSFSTFHHIIAEQNIPLYLTPGAVATNSLSGGATTTRALADAISDVLQYCFDHKEPLCVPGATWSLSNILSPKNVLVDQGAYNKVVPVPQSMWSADYKTAAAAKKAAPYLIGGGTKIASINRVLGKSKLALQTSGANDGHLLAGCVATGTHGSALDIGAVHDTVLGVYLVTAPGKAVFVQPTKRLFEPSLAATLAQNTGLSTTELCDDDAYGAAIVGLGAMGFVHSMVVEAVPLYEFTGNVKALPLRDPDVWNAMATLDTSKFGPGRPYHFSVVLSPYADDHANGAFVTTLWARPPSRPFADPTFATSMSSTDTTRLISKLVDVFGGPVTGPILAKVISDQTAGQYTPGKVGPLFPGQMFGPTTLPPGNGRSTEIVVDHKSTVAALDVVLGALASERKNGRLLLGAIGVRFVKKTRSLLGMNINDMNTYIELPSLQSDQITQVHKACWSALSNAGITFTCHWGQEYGMNAQSVRGYYGDRVDRWKQARAKVLSPEAMAVFSNGLLANVGLG
ncbi:MAG: hypothetical protein JNK05_09480 [Myxococcales bacterium]|nr:hypothetical protein [Myxococcales bacterium]